MDQKCYRVTDTNAVKIVPIELIQYGKIYINETNKISMSVDEFLSQWVYSLPYFLRFIVLKKSNN